MRRLSAVMCVLAGLLFAQAASAAPIKLSTISLSAGSVSGGTSVTGTATLTGAAGKNGVTVTLSSSNTSVATTPANVLVPQGATSATFTVNTTPVTSATSVVITGNYQATATATLSVTPPALTDFWATNTSFIAGREYVGVSVGLSGNAPAGGMTVTIQSNNAAAVVPGTLTVPAGQMYANFVMYGNPVSSPTTVILTATLNGVSRMIAVTINPCVVTVNWSPNGVFPPQDVAWFDDTLPPGMTLDTAVWDTSQAAGGTQSLKLPWGSGAHGATLSGATTTMTVNANERLVGYFLYSDCATPREIVFSWHIAGGAWKSAYWGTPLIGGESAMYAMTNANTYANHDSWARFDIPASLVGLEGATIDGFRIQAFDGAVWFDHIGKTCFPPFAAPPESITDTVWIDDAFPAGTNMGNDFWTTSQHALGTKSLSSGDPVITTTFMNTGQFTAAPRFYVGPGEKLTFWILISSCTPMSSLEVWWDSDTVPYGPSGRASWGYPASGTTYMGPLPSAGGWVRMEVPASAVGLEDRNINLITFKYNAGSFWVDAIGKASASCVPSFATPPSIPAGDTVVVEDSGGAVNYVWDAGQHAAGTQSVRGLYFGSGTHDTSIGGITMPVHYGENLVAYVLLNECAPPPTALALEWDREYTTGIYWGSPSNLSELPLLRPAGTPMPTPGVWTRVEIPARLVGLEESTVTSVRLRMQGNGQAWLDHIGTSGTICTMGTPSQPTFPGTDVVWVDDPPAGQYSNVNWTTARVASGTQSIVEGGVCMNCTGFNQIDDIAPTNGVTALVTGDKVVFYMLVSECAPPSEIMIRFGMWNGDVKGVYWGTPHNLDEGTLYSSMGTVPAGGQWIRVEIPISQLGVVPGTWSGSVRNLFFYSVDGQVWFDRIGKTAQ